MKADVHNIEDLATKLSNIPPTFLSDFLSPEEENTLFLNDLEEEFLLLFFFSYLYVFLAKITDYLQGSSQNQFSQFSELACSIHVRTNPAGQF